MCSENITLLIFEQQTSRSEHLNRNAEIYQIEASRAFSTIPAITLLILEQQTSRSEHPNRNVEIYQMAGSRAFSSFAYVSLVFLTFACSFLRSQCSSSRLSFLPYICLCLCFFMCVCLVFPYVLFVRTVRPCRPYRLIVR